ncbi:MAG: lysoplasmalogenase [Mycobacterium sp.]|nr:lysoplasmalogenase [Mycobacterium sp.]
MEVPYAPRLVSGGWVLAGWAGIGYGVYLTVLALRSPPGTELTGHWILQPPFQALTALLLAGAAAAHPIVRERRWLTAALLLSAAGNWLLAIPWWTMSVVIGLGAFLLAHLCFLAALVPLARGTAPSAPRIAAAVLVGLAALVLLAWFWPQLSRDQLTIPVTAYLLVLTAMVCTAQLAQLPTIWAAVGAGCFAASDAMSAIGGFVLHNAALSVPIWWLYAAAQVLITAGFFFGRDEAVDAVADDELVDWPVEGFE